jgi:hypothetical protein
VGHRLLAQDVLVRLQGREDELLVVVRVFGPAPGADVNDVDVAPTDHFPGVNVDVGYPELLRPLLGQLAVHVAESHHITQG